MIIKYFLSALKYDFKFECHVSEKMKTNRWNWGGGVIQGSSKSIKNSIPNSTRSFKKMFTGIFIGAV